MTEESEDTPARDVWSILLVALLIGLGGAAALGWLWWITTPEKETLAALEEKELTQLLIPVRTAPEEPGRYVGNATCRECHPGESAAFARTAHARTLRRAASDPIAQWLDGKTVEDPERSGVEWSYHLRGDTLTVDRREKSKTQSVPIDFCFGSGHTGITFVTAMKSGPDALPVGIEHRLSYLAVGRKLGITPGQQGEGQTGPGTKTFPFGRLLDENHLQHCFDCHVTTTSRRDRHQLDTDTMIPNITCERCHGPASEHVVAARRGGADGELRMLLGLDRASPSAQITACGECHRSANELEMGTIEPDDLQIVRFQPVGLAKSKCFQGGKSGLSCTSCHDPHRRVSKDAAAYEAICIQCHQAAGGAKTLCSVSPAKDCLGCHMPRRGLTPEFVFTDHWIRVVSKTPPAASAD